MSNKNLLLISIAILTMALLAACGEPLPPNAAPAPPATQEQVAVETNDSVNLRFTIWSGNEAHLAMLNGFAEAYRQAHPEVTIQFDVIPFGDYIEKVTVQLAGSNPPDAGWVAESSAPTFINAGVLADLAPALNQNADYNYGDLSESALQLWQSGGTLYGVPFSTSPYLVLYNQDLFDAAGVETPHQLLDEGKWTWTALAEAAKRITDASPPGVYGFESLDAGVYTNRVWHTLIPIIRAYGSDAWNVAGTECTLNSAGSLAAVQLYHDMVFVDGSAVPPGEQADFYSGQSAITIAQLSRVARLEDAPFQWGIVPLPAGPAGASPVIGQAAITVFNASQHKDVAIDFVAFMTNKENVATMAQFFPPARLSVLESQAFLEANPLVDAESMEQSVVASIQSGSVLPTHVEYPKIDLTARVQFENLWLPEADVEAVLTDICQSIEPFLGG